ncbi:MAG: DNA polymerase III subunit delta [Nitrospirota bacterium]|nr:DNA polymerase III subunit delta [Nitrospirota bacterium]
MSYKNLLDEIKKGFTSKSYLLNSSDRFLHAEAVSLIKGIIPPEELDFNFQSFDMLSPEQEKTAFDQILDVLNTVPFFSGRKYVVIENSQKIAKKDLKKLENYLQIPSGTSVLVLLYEGSLKKDAKESFKGVKQISLDIREGDMPAWIVEKAKLKGLNISKDAAQYLLAVIGPDLGMLSTEIEKLTLVGKPEIEKGDIAEIIEGKRIFGAFDLINAIRDRDKEKVFRIYSVLRETEEPYGLLGALNWQYAQMLGEKNSPNERNYLYEVFRLLNSADLGIKTGGFYPFELLLVKLLRLSPAR